MGSSPSTQATSQLGPNPRVTVIQQHTPNSIPLNQPIAANSPNPVQGNQQTKTNSANNDTSSNNQDNISAPVVPNSAYDLSTFGYNAYFEFPTHHLLRFANQSAASTRSYWPRDAYGRLYPYPTIYPKSQVFNLNKYDAVDKFALQVDTTQYYNTYLQSFTQHLTYYFQNDQMSTARVIFRWLTAQDIEKYKNMKIPYNETVLWHLTRVQQDNNHYAKLFLTMCNYAGLYGTLVTGCTKHAFYEIGDHVGQDGRMNTWTAVVINNEWRFVDPHWASSARINVKREWQLLDDNGKLGQAGAQAGPEATIHAYNETYFLTNPEELIYSHLPTSHESLQLLARPITYREFIEMAHLKKGFFDNDLRLLDQRKCILHAFQGEIEIKIGTPPNKQMKFMYRLWMSGKQDLGGTNLSRFCIMQQKHNILVSRIFFPLAGKFKFELFVRPTSDVNFNLACAYVIHSDQPAVDVKAFPANNCYEWGPGPDLEAVGMTPVTHHDAVIEAEAGSTDIRFKAKGPVDISHELHSNNLTTKQLAGYTVHYMDKDDIVMKVRLPEAGDYALNIYAKEPGKDGGPSCVCSYIVSSAIPSADQSPFSNQGQIGATAAGHPLGLKLSSHDTPIITCPDTGVLQLTFDTPVPCDLHSKFILTEDNSKSDDKSEYVLKEPGKNQTQFTMNIPEPGLYTFQLHGKRVGEDGEPQLVYTVLIDAPVPKEDCAPFPETGEAWTTGCMLNEPTTRILAAASKVNMNLKVPNGRDVSAVCGEKVTPLTSDGDDIWLGEVDTGEPGKDLLITAKLGDSDTPACLLRYKMKEADLMQKEQEKQQQLQAVAAEKNLAMKEKERKAAENREKEFMAAKTALHQAMADRDLKALHKCVKTLEKKKFVGRVQADYDEAWKMIRSLERMRRLQQAILELDQNTMLEIKNYANPPELVHKVMIAALLLMGDSEAQTKEWSSCKKHLVTIGKDGLYNRLKNCDFAKLHPEIVARAARIIGDFRFDDVNDTSAGAGAFYAWVAGMIEEVHSIKPENAKAKPANAKRQAELLK